MRFYKSRDVTVASYNAKEISDSRGIASILSLEIICLAMGKSQISVLKSTSHWGAGQLLFHLGERIWDPPAESIWGRAHLGVWWAHCTRRPKWSFMRQLVTRSPEKKCHIWTREPCVLLTRGQQAASWHRQCHTGICRWSNSEMCLLWNNWLFSQTTPRRLAGH